MYPETNQWTATFEIQNLILPCSCTCYERKRVILLRCPLNKGRRRRVRSHTNLYDTCDTLAPRERLPTIFRNGGCTYIVYINKHNISESSDYPKNLVVCAQFRFRLISLFTSLQFLCCNFFSRITIFFSFVFCFIRCFALNA